MSIDMSSIYLIRLEPNNVKTIEAINRLENALVAKLENHHLELEADDIPDSDEEVISSSNQKQFGTYYYHY